MERCDRRCGTEAGSFPDVRLPCPPWLAVLGITAYLFWGAAGLGIVLSFADGLVWGLYALLEGDRSIMVFGVLQMTTSAAVVAAKVCRTPR